MPGKISVTCFGELTKTKAERDLRKQLRDMAADCGVKLVGRPSISTSEQIPNWWNGSAVQEYK